MLSRFDIDPSTSSLFDHLNNRFPLLALGIEPLFGDGDFDSRGRLAGCFLSFYQLAGNTATLDLHNWLDLFSGWLQLQTENTTSNACRPASPRSLTKIDRPI